MMQGKNRHVIFVLCGGAVVLLGLATLLLYQRPSSRSMPLPPTPVVQQPNLQPLRLEILEKFGTFRGTADDIEWLRMCMTKAKYPYDRVLLIKLAGSAHTDDALEFLSEIVRGDFTINDRMMALGSLSRMRVPEAFRRDLIKALKEGTIPEEISRDCGIFIVSGQVSPEFVERALFDLAGTSSGSLREFAASRISPQTRRGAALLHRLGSGDEDPRVRLAALRNLVRSASEDQLQTRVGSVLTREADVTVRIGVLSELGTSALSGSSGARVLLKKVALEDPSPDVRTLASALISGIPRK